jgi:IMP dehydrogenase
MRFLNDLRPLYDLTYSDVFLVPQKTNANSRFDVSLQASDGTGNTIPIVVANMTAVAGKRMAETVARRGGIAVLPQDTPMEILESTVAAIKSADTILDTPITLEPHHTVRDAMSLIHKRAHGAVVIVDEKNRPVGIFTEEDAAGKDIFTPLSTAATGNVVTLDAKMSPTEMYDFLYEKHLRVAPVVKGGKLVGMMSAHGTVRSEIYQPNLDKNGKLKVAVAIGINGDIAEKTRKALALGADVLVLDTAHGHQEKMVEAIKAARTVDKNIPIAAGNVVTAEATRELIEAGANIVKVGIGPGAMCTTRMMTGVGRPQFSAVMECSAEARKLGGTVWADGGAKYPRDVALALAAGADNVMLGSWLAGTHESAADIQQDNEGRLFKENFGMASRRAVKYRNIGTSGYELAKKELFEEGISTSRMYIDPEMPGVEDIIDQIVAGVRSAFTYEGATNLKEFQDRAVVGIQSASGYKEGKPRANNS